MATARIVPCRSCSRAVATDSRFCPNCGVGVDRGAAAPGRPRRNAVGGAVALASGATMAVAAFLPWQVVRIPGADPERTPIRGWEASTDAVVLVGLALLVAVCSAVLFTVVEQVPLLLTKVVLAVVGLIGLAVAVLDIADVQGHSDPRFSVEVGMGLYVAAGTAAVAIVAGAMARARPVED